MGIRLAPLSIFQWGKEVTSGTAVAATTQIAAPTVDFDDDDELGFPQLARGYLIGNTGSEFVLRRGMNWSVPAHPPNFTQMLQWMSMSLGSIAAPGASPAGVFTWNFTRPLATVPIPETYTLERRLSDGTTFTDFEWAYCHAKSWQLNVNGKGEVTFAINGFGRRRQPSTLTPAINPVAALIPSGARTTISIDATFGGLGGTLVSTQFLDCNLQFDSGFFPIFTCDNRPDQDFTIGGFDPRNSHFNLDVTFLVQGQYATELAQAELIGSAALAGIRYIRVEITHPTFITGSSTYLMRFDMVALCKKGSLVKIDEQDGQCIYRLKVGETANGVNPWFSATIRNGSSAIS